MNLKSKLFASAVAFTMVLSLVAVPVSAQTTAELTAQINSLLAMIAQLQAQVAGGTTTGAATTFTTDLTVGSKGAEVSALQTWLVSKGHLVMPAGVAMGYFGSLTQSALAKYQVSVGITPAAGYFGPITRAKINATGGTTGGTTTGGSVGITTPGMEGSISVVEASAGTVSTVYEGDSMASVLGVKVTATGSDMAVQRMKFDLDENVTSSDTKFYNKIFKKLYVTEGGNVLASIDLNSSTVTKDGTDYLVTVSGFNSVVPKGTSKTYLIKLDAQSSIDSADFDTETYTVALATDGVRAVDGAGIDDYAGSASIAATPTVAADLTDSATLALSLNASSPKKQDVVCTSNTTEDECDRLTVLVFDAKAEKDAVTITDLQIGVAKSGTGGAIASSTVYLYDGSTELDAASVTGVNTYIFSDFDQTIAKDTTKTYTVKMDVRDANTTDARFVVTASSTGITDENSKGDAVTDSGSATGYSIGIMKSGPELSLVSKSITTSNTPQGSTLAGATSTLTASFSVKIKAVGGDILLGTIASGSPLFEDDGSDASFVVYKNGVAVTSLSNSTSTAFTIPSTCVTTGTASCLLAEGSEVTVPVTYLIQGRTATVGTAAASGLYAIGLENINWVGPTGVLSASTFMSGETDWRTADISFP
ncbi:MAG: peptidoglycan-binding domain-containing protein [Candidatus Paceibacterota bacterium]|jgi:hypothetical protein